MNENRQIVVRLAKQEELEAVNIIRRQVNDVHVEGRPDFFRPGFADELARRVYAQFDSQKADVIVALEGETVCGYAMVEYIDRPQSPYMCARRFYHVEEFGVDAAYRRQGVGAKLVAFMKRDAAQKGFARIELDAWAFNQGAMRFYEDCGFKVYRRFMEMEV